MSIKNYFAIVLSLGLLGASQQAFCTKRGHTIAKKRLVNKKTGEVRYIEEVTHHEAVDLAPGTALVQNKQSNGIGTSAIVDRSELNATADETGISARPFKSGSRYERQSGYGPSSEEKQTSYQQAYQTYQSYQAREQACKNFQTDEEAVALVYADPLANNLEEDNKHEFPINEISFPKNYNEPDGSYGSIKPTRYKDRSDEKKLKRLGAITLGLCGSAIGFATSASGIWMMHSALERMKTPLADEIVCKKSKLNYETFYTGRPVALSHTGSCQPCSFFQRDFYQATGYEGSVCYHSGVSCCSQWTRRLNNDDEWIVDSSTSVTYNDDTYQPASSSYSSSSDSSSSSSTSRSFSSSSNNQGNTHSCAQRLYYRQVAVCPPEAIKADYSISFSYQGEQEEQTIQCPRSRTFTQSEYAQYCNVHNDFMNFAAGYDENDYTCYLKKEGRDENNLCKSLSDGRPWHHGQNLKFVGGILVTALGSGFVYTAVMTGVNMYN